MAAFETKQYRNLFSLIGKEDQEINNRLNEIFETFFYGSEEERIYHPRGKIWDIWRIPEIMMPGQKACLMV